MNRLTGSGERPRGPSGAGAPEGEKSLRVLIAAGGTGGHIYPGLAVAEELRRQVPSAQIRFVGTRRGMEGRLVPAAGFPLEFIHAEPLPRRPTPRALRALAATGFGVVQALGLLRRFSPHVVLGTGAYVSAPAIVAAWILGIPRMIQEQNARPGITNRLLAPLAQRIAVGYPDAIPLLGGGEGGRRAGRVVCTGNPIRAAIVAAERGASRRALGFDGQSRVVVIFGASQGARRINEAVLQAMDRIRAHRDWQVLHATGATQFDSVARALGARGFGAAPAAEGAEPVISAGNLRIVPYIHQMPQALASADLVVCRASAMSIAEVSARGLPAVLVPYPFAAEAHQEHNARAMEKAGAALVVPDRDLTGDALIAALEGLLGEPGKLERMAHASRQLGRPEASRTLVASLLELARGTA